MKDTITLAAAAVVLMAGAVSARAGCVHDGKLTSGSQHTIPGYIVATMKPPASSVTRTAGGNAAHNIVGTWLVTYTAGGSPSGQAFIQWHDDFTEWENINFPIEGGNICVGSWKPVDPTNVTRTHYGWLYTAGILSGYFTEIETDKVANRNAYTGVNDTKIYDLSGNVVVEFPGTSSAVRIAP